MQSNLFLFTGDETYLIHQEVMRWKQSFQEKHGDINLQTIDGKTADVSEIVSQISAMPFLGDKRLIFIENLPEVSKGKEKEDEEESEEEEEEKKKDPLETLAAFLPQLPETSIVAFVQPRPDKRRAFYKALVKLAQLKEFKPLEGPVLHKWITERVQSRQGPKGAPIGGKIAPEAIPHLVDLTGGDLWKLSSEIEKLVTHQDGAPITRDTIDQLVVPTLEANIFQLTDALGGRDPKKAIEKLHQSIAANDNLRQIFYMIVRQFRLFLLIKAYLEQNPSAPFGATASALKLHPFVVRTIQSQVKHFDAPRLKAAYQKLLEIDTGLKTSRIKVTVENQSELAMAIERFIVDFACP